MSAAHIKRLLLLQKIQVRHLPLKSSESLVRCRAPRRGRGGDTEAPGEQKLLFHLTWNLPTLIGGADTSMGARYIKNVRGSVMRAPDGPKVTSMSIIGC